jgi:hypothetical protein
MTEDCIKGFRGDSCFAGDDFAADDDGSKDGGIFGLVCNVNGSPRGCEATCGFEGARGNEELAATDDDLGLTRACPEEGATGDATFFDDEKTS